MITASSFRSRIMGAIGNVLEHYDSALFGLLAPFIAPLFFTDSDPLMALILTYAILPLGILTRPLGSLFFGWIGDRLGRRQALFYSLSGMAVVTVGMGCLPTHADVGMVAALFLALGRMLQNFCAAGETTGGAIFILEHTEVSKRSLMSSLYGASSVGGILVASGLVTLLSYQGIIQEGWRLLFWLGGLAGVMGVFLRFKAQEGNEFKKQKELVSTPKMGLMQVLKEHRRVLVYVVCAGGFSHATYALAFTLMNGYIPMVTSLTQTTVMQINTAMLLIDLLLLPYFGYLAEKFGKERVMLGATLCSVFGGIPLFFALEQSGLVVVILVRLVIVVMGVAFAAPYHAWTLERVLPQHRYTVLSLGSALGSQFMGAPTAVACLWLYQKMGWVAAPGLYLMLIGLLASYAVIRSVKRESEKDRIEQGNAVSSNEDARGTVDP